MDEAGAGELEDWSADGRGLDCDVAPRDETSGAGARAILSSEVLKDFRYLKVLSRFLFSSPEMLPVFELVNGAPRRLIYFSEKEDEFLKNKATKRGYYENN